MISENIIKLQKIKTDIKLALESKGLHPTNNFASYANLIKSLDSPLSELPLPESDGTWGTELLKAWNEKVETIYDRYTSSKGGTVDTVGLKKLNWSNEDIKYLQDHCPWTEDLNELFKVSQFEIDYWEKIKSTYLNNSADTPVSDNTWRSILSITDARYLVKFFPKINTSLVVSVSGSFSSWLSLITIPKLDLSSATTVESLFSGCYSLLIVPELEYPNVTTAADIFNNCYSLYIVPKLEFPKVTNIYNLFYYCYSLLIIPKVDAPVATNAGYMCSYCTSLKYVSVLNLPKAQNFQNSFLGCNALELMPWINADFTNTYYMFNNCYNLKYVPAFNLSKVTSLSYMFQNAYSLTELPNFSILSATSLDYFCYNCLALESINMDLKSVTSCLYSFLNCYSLKNVHLNNTQRVTSLYYAFQYCRSLLDITLDCAAVTTMYYCFGYCCSLKTVTLYNTDKVNNIGYTFYLCYSLKEIPSFNLNAVTSTNYLGIGCQSLTTVHNGLKYSNTFDGNTRTFSTESLLNMLGKANNPSTFTQTIYLNAQAAREIYEYSLNPEEEWMPVNNGLLSALDWLATFAQSPNKPTKGAAIYLTFASGSSNYSDVPTITYKDVSIVADPCKGNNTTTKLHCTYLVDLYFSGSNRTVTDQYITEDVTSPSFPLNPSETESITREVTYSAHGFTTVVTIELGVWVNKSLSVDLNSQWTNSSTSLSGYNVYMSSSNYNVNNGYASIKISFMGYPNFKIYINSYAESSYDYTIAWGLDLAAPISNPSSSSAGVKAHTSSYLYSPTSISNYKEVVYPNDGEQHFVWITYRKDGSVNSNNDRGYVAIPIDQ